MSILAFLDLDDTIFQTMPKCPPGERLEIAAVNSDGSPGSFMTTRQRRLVDWLLSSTHVVPATGRNLSAYQRVRVTFPGQAILNHGGTIVDARGEPDLGWYELIDGSLVPDALAEVKAAVDREGLGLRTRLIGDHGRVLYLSIKDPGGEVAKVEACAELLAGGLDPSLRMIFSANNLAVLPRAFSKGRAAKHLLASLPARPELVIGLADTPSDAGLLAACDFAGLPRASPLMRTLLGASLDGLGDGEP